MGKRRRKLHSPKFATKYAKLRAAKGILQETTEEALEDNIITEAEAEEIQEAEEKVANALKQLPPEEATVQIEDPVSEVEEVEKPKPKPRRKSTKKTTTAKPKATRTRKPRKPKAAAEG